jgi:protein SCO1/2
VKDRRGKIEKGRLKIVNGVAISARHLLIVLFFFLSSNFYFLAFDIAHAQDPLPQDLIKGVRFEQKLDQQLPLELRFRDETGQVVQLADYFDKKPVILVFAYYECPMLCTLVLNGLLTSLNELPFDIGNQFEIVTVSIDPEETPELATAKKEVYLKMYGRSGAEAGWHFLTGEETAIRQLTQAAGFYYQYDPERDEYAHPTGIMIVTPQGKLARYFYGIDFPVRDLRLGLIEAAHDKIGSPVDQLLLLCYHYDPVVGQYSLTIMNIIRTAGVMTVVVLGAVIFMMLRRDRSKKFVKSSYG